MKPATTSSVTPLACAERISSRRKPNVSAPAGRARGQAQREQREAERAGVGEHVAGVGEQRQRVRDHPGGDLARHHDQDQRQRPPQPRGVLRRSVRVEAVIVGHGPKIREARPL